MNCEKCGNPLKPGDKFCMKCGTKVPDSTATPAAPATPVAPVTSAAPATPVTPVAPAATAAPTVPVTPVTAPATPKKKKSFVGLGIVAAIVLVVVVGIGMNAKKISNTFSKTFSSSEKYYAKVEGESINTLTSMATKTYDSFLSATKDSSKKISGEINVEIGEALSDLISLATMRSGIDISKIKSAGVEYEANLDDKSASMEYALKLNKDSLISAKLLMDMDKMAAYATVPDLNEKYLGLELEEMGMPSYYLDMLSSSFAADFTKDLPDAKELDKVINKYLNIALNSIEKVKKTSTTMEASGVEQKVTALEIEVDAEVLEDVLTAVLEEAIKDKELKELIITTVDALAQSDFADYLRLYDVDGQDVYDELMDEMEYILDELSDMIDDLDDFDIEYVLYVDSDGDVCGRDVTVKTDYNKVHFVSLLAQSGGKFGAEINLTVNGNKFISITGEGKSSHNKLTGDFQVKFRGVTLVKISTEDFDIDSLKEGYLNGSFSISAGSGINTILSAASGMSGMGNVSMIGNILGNVGIKIDFKMSKNNYAYALSVSTNGDELGKVSMSAKISNNGKVSLPKSKEVVFVENNSDIEDWLEDCDINGLIKKWKKTDLPSEILDYLEDMDDLTDLVHLIVFGSVGAKPFDTPAIKREDW